MTLTITSDDPDAGGPCLAATDFMILTINPIATTNAGLDATICSGSTHTLAGVFGGGASSITWTNGAGDGSFDDAILPAATYTPGAADIAAGTVTLTITTDDPAGPCLSVNDAMTLTIDAIATASAGADATICSGSTHTLGGVIGGSASTLLWTNGAGDGVFDDATLAGATYTPGAGDIAAGTVTLTITTDDPAGPCGTATDFMVLTINAIATTSAGADDVICSGSTYTLSGVMGGSATSVTWTNGAGDGSFDDAALLAATYTPGAGDIAGGSVTLTITTNDPDGAGPCSAASDAMTLTINPIATASAGADATICEGSAYTLTGTIGGSASTLLWTNGAGDGVFDDATLAGATYTPGAGDIAAGTVTLTITSDDPDAGGPCLAATDFMILTINPVATVSAGADATICAYFGYTLAGVMGGSATSVVWTSSGTGTFDDNTLLAATYTPSAADTVIPPGFITLTITTNDPDGIGPCVAVSDAMVLTIDPADKPAFSYSSGTYCQSGADPTPVISGTPGGTFTSTPAGLILNPATGEIDLSLSALNVYGVEYLTPGAGGCPDSLTVAVTVTLAPESAFTMADPFCEGDANPFPIFGAGASAGVFSADPAGIVFVSTATGEIDLTASTPGAYEIKNFIAAAGGCAADTDSVNIVINPVATVGAGANDTICELSTYTLSGVFGGSASSVLWTSPGDGTFTGTQTLPAATYTPGAGDIAAGDVMLTITTDDPDGAGPCVAVQDSMLLTINLIATVTAGGPATICAGSSYTLLGAMGGSATSITWATSGTGSFDNNTLLGAVYTPDAGDIGLGTVTLTITTNDPDGAGQPCLAVSDPMVLTIDPIATVTASVDDTICEGTTFTTAGAIGGSALTLLWTNGAGDGSFNDATLAASTYTPGAGDIATGDVTLTITTDDPVGPCPAVSDAILLTFNLTPTSSAGPDATICSGSTHTLAGGAMGGSASSVTWTSTGTGTYDNPILINPVYTPSAADIAAGTDTLIITTNDPDGPEPCVAAIDSMVLTINPIVTISAGPDDVVCSDLTYTMAGSRGGGASSSTWTSSGDGAFDVPGNVAAVYTPGAGDIAAGTVTLKITSDDPVGPCTALADSMVLTIFPVATVSAGADDVICAGSTYTLSGLMGGGASSITWTSTGTGSFDNASLLAATYTPSAADIAAGTDTLIITTDDPAGPCLVLVDSMVLTIDVAATATAGVDVTICAGTTYILPGAIGGSAVTLLWTNGAGDGTFDDNTLAGAEYTPGAGDIVAGTVTLTITSNDPAGPCPAAVDPMILTISNDATVSAGIDTSICSDLPITLSGVMGGGATSVTWTSTGTGAFDNVTLLAATYTPSAADIAAGTDTLIITTNDPDGAGPCIAALDSMILTINPVATVSANVDDVICENSTYTMSGSRGGGASSSTWTSSGDGVFDVPGNVAAVYTPGAGDIAAGTVTLKITTNDPAGPCLALADSMVLTIDPIATVSAGADDVICSGSTYTLSGVMGGGASTITWTSTGGGTFDNASLLGATLTPSASSIADNGDTLIITTDDPAGPCGIVIDSMILTINGIATVSAGADDTICADNTYTLSGVMGGTAASITWTTSGSGSFDNAALLAATYTLSTADSLAGAVTLYITTNDPDGGGPCLNTIDSMLLTIDPLPTVVAGPDVTICQDSVFTLAGAMGGASASVTWTNGAGDGVFSNPTLLTPTYTPGVGDIAAGTVTLTITSNDPAGPCPAAVDFMIMTIDPEATASAGPADVVCATFPYTLAGARGGSAVSSTWTTSGTGTFDDASIVGATYTHTAADILMGSVTLTITTNDPAGPCDAAVSTMILTISTNATTSADVDDVICAGSTYTLNGSMGSGATGVTWTSTGTGTFDNAALLAATYTPSDADTTNRTDTLIITTNDPDGAGPCLAAIDSMVLTINPIAIVSAGPDDTICADNTYTLSGTMGGTANTITWTTSGSGSFDNAALLAATYTLSTADSLAGAVTLYITTNDPDGGGPCLNTIDSMLLTIDPLPTVVAGPDVTICQDSVFTLAGAMGGASASVTWTNGAGDGVFSNPTLLTPTYTPGVGDIAAGTVTLTITSNDPAGPCPAAVDFMIMTIDPEATASAGPADVVCATFPYTLAGARGGSAVSSTWTTSGTGTFDDASIVGATYTHTAADILMGSVTLTITTNDPAGPCDAAVSTMILTISTNATTSADVDDVICAGSTYTLNGSMGSGATGVTWTSTGTGTFDNAALLAATYTPSDADTTNRTDTLIITTNDPDGAGPCLAAIDSMVLTINPIAIVSAGADDVICAGETYTMSGTMGGTASSILWTSSGTGVFVPPAGLAAVYTPSSADSLAGGVTLYITTNDPDGGGPCLNTVDSMILTIDPIPVVSAGVDTTLCSGTSYLLPGVIGGSTASVTWATTGTGTFDNNTLVTPTYTPSAADDAAGSVKLSISSNDPAGPCPIITDTMILTIDPIAIMSAGANDTICSDLTYTLSGSRGGGASSSTWSSSGDGGFDIPGNVSAVYTPGVLDIAAGTVTLTITSDDPLGPCGVIQDSMILTIDPIATSNAGLDATICGGTSHLLSGAIGGGASSSLWTSTGTGTFDSPSILAATYTPSAADILAGTDTLILTTDDPAGPCFAIPDTMILTIDPAATVSAGAADVVCAGFGYTLSGSRGGSALTSTWTTSGTGTFDDSSLVGTIYTASPADVLLGFVTLTITSDDPAGPCPAVTDNMVLTINTDAITSAGVDDTICSGSTYTLSGTMGNGATAITWTTGGSGTFDNVSILTATYTPSFADIIAGGVDLVSTTNDPDGAGPCLAAVDSMVLTINLFDSVSAGADDIICAGSTYTLSGTMGGSTSTILWTSLGGGTFDDPTLLGATYTPSSADSLAGTVTLSITTDDPDGAGPCFPTVDSMVLTLNPVPVMSAGNDTTICEASSFTLLGIMGGSAGAVSWMSTGTGTFDNNTLITPTYTPSAADITAGFVTLGITSDDPAGPCIPVSDSMLLTINPAAISSANVDDTICALSTYTLAGARSGSAVSSVWTTSGTGTFDDSSLLAAIYTPSLGDIAVGSVSLVLTTDDPAGPCPSGIDSLILTINAIAVVSAGADDTICENSTYILAGSMSGSSSAVIWTTLGSGTFDDTTIVASTYTPSVADIAAGTVTLVISSNDPDGLGPCTIITDSVDIQINPIAIVNGGVDAIICSGSSYTLPGAMSGSSSSITWSTTGTGSFDDSTLLGATYTPSPADTVAGSVVLYISSNDPDSVGPCNVEVDSVTLTIKQQILVIAGNDSTVCANAPDVFLNGKVYNGSTTGFWSTSGNGTFVIDSNDLTGTYITSAADTVAGSIVLTLESTNNGGCTPVRDSLLITIDSGIFVLAGPDQTTCAKLPDINMTGVVWFGTTTGYWATNGSGAFTPDSTDLSALYSPTPVDTATGSVLLTLTTTGMNCAAISDNMSLTILPGIAINAGPDQSVCGNNRIASLAGTVVSASGGVWTTSNGTGTFADDSSLVTSYTPSDADTGLGQVTLVLTSTGNGPCVEVADSMILTIDRIPKVDAGPNDTLCANNDTVYLAGSISDGSVTGIWVPLGTGLFIPDDTTLTGVYVPSDADTAAGFVDIILVSTNNFSNCVPESDTLHIIITPAPKPLAGVDLTVCANNSDAPMSASVIGGSSTGVWTTLNSGTFAPNDSDLNAVFTPDTNDVNAGFATVILTTTNNTNCIPEADTVFVQITDKPIADAGPDQGLCSDNATATLIGAVTNATGGIWRTIDGTGSFTDTASFVTFYTASSQDTTNGCILITWTTTGMGNCLEVTDTMNLCFFPNSITVDAIAASTTVCANNRDVNVLGTVTGALGGQWISTGSGTFNNPFSLNAVYTPSDSDTLAGSVILILESTGNGQCNPVFDSLPITILRAPNVNAGPDQTICSNTQAPLNGAVFNQTTTGIWSSGGSGIFTPNDSDLNAQYIPSPTDTLIGTVSIVLASTNNGICNQVFDNMLIILSPTPRVDAGPDQVVCAEFSFANLAGSVNGVTTTGRWTTTGTGTFTPNDSDLFATYNLSTQDTLDTFLYIILSSTNNGICDTVVDSMLITVTFQTPTVVAGPDQTVCGNNANVALSGLVSNGTSTGYWTSTGTGTFLPDSNSLIATYVPSAADTAAPGFVQLTLFATNSCPINDVIDVFITPGPNVNAGSDTALCIGIDTITLSGAVTGGATTGAWITLGSGTFSPDTSTLNALYTLSAADSIAGGVTLVLSSTNISVNCLPETDTIIVSLTTLPVPDAGPDDTACANAPYVLSGLVTGGASSGIWTTLGTGTFDSLATSTTNLNGTYTFSSADTASVTGVQLVLTTTNACINFSDTMTLIDTESPIVDAGFDLIVCANNDTVPLNGSVNIVTTTGQWSAPSGDGVFLPNDSDLTGIYVPGPIDAASGIVYLVLTSTNNANCLPVTDTIAVTISPDPVVNTGPDVNQCKSDPDVTLAGSVTGGSATGAWTVLNGNGTLLPNNISLNAQYIPDSSDIAGGGVTIVLESTNNGLCIVVYDTLQIIWTDDPIVDAGPDQTACVDTNGIPLAGSVTGGTTTGIWSTLGTGIFDTTDTALDANYLPSLADEAAGSVLLVLSSTQGCKVVTDTMWAETNPVPLPAFTFSKNCNSMAVIFTDQSSVTTGSVTSWNWNFGDSNTSTAQNPTNIYADSGQYTVTLVITTDSSCTNTISQSFGFGSLRADFVVAGNCVEDPFEFRDSSSVFSDSIVSWSWVFGDGGISSAQNPAYTYGISGTYQVILTITTQGGCTDSDTLILLVNPNPVAGFTFGTAAPTILEEVQFLDNSSGANSWIWDLGDGSASTVQNPTHTYVDVGMKQVTQIVINTNTGCRDSITIAYRIANVYPPALPRSFSPNGDGQNDTLYVRGGPFKVVSFDVYNEWGELIFESDRQDIGWDGTKKGVPQPVGVYVYVVTATTLNDLSFENTGDVSLIR
ncbi:gliding motility-associated C-terminal domain-containing protein [Flavobacteriales bacterium AH-315-E23]|nr:gliding motility-associated C-terminal domain-containing protein [Flavobacteriales bacterium AH-315-E23]